MLKALVKKSTLISISFFSVLCGFVSPLVADQPEWVAAEVRSIDLDNARVTLRHQEIKSLNMSAMTMVFSVGDASMLEKIKVGESVVFTVVRKEGRLVVTEIKPAPHEH